MLAVGVFGGGCLGGRGRVVLGAVGTHVHDRAMGVDLVVDVRRKSLLDNFQKKVKHYDAGYISG